MSNGTLSTQFELLSRLADNNTKAITAADVSNIVKSNFQPVMIWSGVFVRNDGSTAGGNRWHPRTLYYNPDFFQPRSTGVGISDATQVWRFTNRGNLANNTTYLNVQVQPSAMPGVGNEYANAWPTQPATFNLYTDGNGAVSSYDVVTCGNGWFGPAGLYSGSATTGSWSYPGQKGTMPISGFSQIPEVEFIGPLSPTPATNPNPYFYSNPAWYLSTNSNQPTASIPGQGASADHTFLNTQTLHSLSDGKGEQRYNPGWWMGPTPQQTGASGLYKNQLSAEGLESGGSDVPNSVTLWRMPF
tara:strand:- start:152 stop:1054 length:903 start_codon:yes stop_codon:yes gene_type:complete